MGQKDSGEGAGLSWVFSAILRSLGFTLAEKKNPHRDVGRKVTWCELPVKRFAVAAGLKIYVMGKTCSREAGWKRVAVFLGSRW